MKCVLGIEPNVRFRPSDPPFYWGKVQGVEVG